MALKIQGKDVLVPAEKKELISFLSDMNNFKGLLPEDKISEWSADTDQCSFKVTGGYTIGLKRDEITDQGMRIVSSDKAPFKFVLDIVMSETAGKTSLNQNLNADVNAFVSMMVEKPLRNLFDHIADKLVAHFS